jgi:hypothetical protein
LWQLRCGNFVATVPTAPSPTFQPERSDKTLEDTLSAVRRAKAIIAVKSIQQQSIKNGLDKITVEEINTEIKISRKERER